MSPRGFVARGINESCISLFILLVISMVAVGIAFYVDRPLSVYILQENGPLEVIGFASCVVSAGLFAWVARYYARKSEWVSVAWFAAMSVALFLCAMEEISWGQQIFKWATPDYFAGNMQGETNIHNMPMVHGRLQEACIELVFVYFVIVPVLGRFSNTVMRLIEKVKLPLPPFSVSALVGACFVLANGPFAFSYYFSQGTPINYGEMQEAFYQLCFVLFSYNERAWANAASTSAVQLK
ncbi:MAG: hypothetical protein KDJ62_01435 [Rhodobiaceae bacterium]|nr:hypothetical protein [Rhodobiaceae bacterium]MCC0047920.1 hypothetical protein [Rhodobiaceae bacterium]